MTTIGLIGNGNHSKRIQKILKEEVYTYKPTRDIKKDLENFEILKKKKIIFICSPNNTHFFYIQKLYKNRYIFCEKPPVVTKNELNKLKKISYKKIFFDFNQRFSSISKILKASKSLKMGKLLYGSIINSHGLAFKKDYKNSWRSDLKKSRLGVFETVSVHDVDLINYYFDVYKIKKPILRNFQNVGTSFDTAYSTILLKHGGQINIFSSYSSSCLNEWILMFENGIIEASDRAVSLYSPTMNFDKNGNFIKPKKKIYLKIFKNDYQESLKKSIKYFMSVSKNKKFFKKRDFKKSISTNNLIIS
jgi:predicted dehydrogenase